MEDEQRARGAKAQDRHRGRDHHAAAAPGLFFLDFRFAFRRLTRAFLGDAAHRREIGMLDVLGLRRAIGSRVFFHRRGIGHRRLGHRGLRLRLRLLRRGLRPVERA